MLGPRSENPLVEDLSAAKLVITMTKDGAVSVAGCIDQKMLCYGLLEMAKDGIRTHVAESGSIKIARPGVQA